MRSTPPPPRPVFSGQTDPASRHGHAEFMQCPEGHLLGLGQEGAGVVSGLTLSREAPTAAVPTLQTPREEGVQGPDWTEPVSPRVQLSSVFITEDLLCSWPG